MTIGKQNPAITTFLESINPKLKEAKATATCWKCHKPFTSANVFTEAGWREAQISNTCEACFDAIFAEQGEE